MKMIKSFVDTQAQMISNIVDEKPIVQQQERAELRHRLRDTQAFDYNSRLGRFAWTQINENCPLPIIFRGVNSSKEEYLCVQMLRQKIFSYYPQQIFDYCVQHYPIRFYSITPHEAELLNKINSWHSNAAFGNQLYTTTDQITQLSSFKIFYDLLRTTVLTSNQPIRPQPTSTPVPRIPVAPLSTKPSTFFGYWASSSLPSLHQRQQSKHNRLIAPKTHRSQTQMSDDQHIKRPSVIFLTKNQKNMEKKGATLILPTTVHQVSKSGISASNVSNNLEVPTRTNAKLPENVNILRQTIVSHKSSNQSSSMITGENQPSSKSIITSHNAVTKRPPLSRPLSSSSSTNSGFHRYISFHGEQMLCYYTSQSGSNTPIKSCRCLALQDIIRLFFPKSNIERLIQLCRLKDITRYKPEKTTDVDSCLRLVNIEDLQKHWSFLTKELGGATQNKTDPSKTSSASGLLTSNKIIINNPPVKTNTVPLKDTCRNNLSSKSSTINEIQNYSHDLNTTPSALINPTAEEIVLSIDKQSVTTMEEGEIQIPLENNNEIETSSLPEKNEILKTNDPVLSSQIPEISLQPLNIEDRPEPVIENTELPPSSNKIQEDELDLEDLSKDNVCPPMNDIVSSTNSIIEQEPSTIEDSLVLSRHSSTLPLEELTAIQPLLDVPLVPDQIITLAQNKLVPSDVQPEISDSATEQSSPSVVNLSSHIDVPVVQDVSSSRADNPQMEVFEEFIVPAQTVEQHVESDEIMRTATIDFREVQNLEPKLTSATFNDENEVKSTPKRKLSASSGELSTDSNNNKTHSQSSKQEPENDIRLRGKRARKTKTSEDASAFNNKKMPCPLTATKIKPIITSRTLRKRTYTKNMCKSTVAKPIKQYPLRDKCPKSNHNVPNWTKQFHIKSCTVVLDHFDPMAYDL